MAVIDTPKGRVIGLFIKDEQPKPEPKEISEDTIFGNEQPKRGRPKKQ